MGCDVLVNVLGKIKVDDVLHVRNIETSCRHRRGHENGRAALLEAPQRILTLKLCSIAVDRRRRVPEVTNVECRPSEEKGEREIRR